MLTQQWIQIKLHSAAPSTGFNNEDEQSRASPNVYTKPKSVQPFRSSVTYTCAVEFYIQGELLTCENMIQLQIPEVKKITSFFYHFFEFIPFEKIQAVESPWKIFNFQLYIINDILIWNKFLLYWLSSPKQLCRYPQNWFWLKFHWVVKLGKSMNNSTFFQSMIWGWVNFFENENQK